ncbi:UDP-N-acetylmuramoyl-tripeptide--D-alanyl-D-alanine ligase [Sphingomonas sp.]|uniref:UDP-N-acetylmuramoyl-tripeptide--D-alanyl-D- alanine ligase n=1 Tax=Sphingomonas sp. TaxID=28214 RepID=UPI0025DA778E|nr:UDP-N-acetylmuramoyl-tripeptide--D-alanyl-D-alanine ligase [Sphingomonas sp.]
MSPLWTSEAIAAATGGVASGSFAATGVAFDSREIGVGDLFVAMPGEVTDGHRFIDGAFARGAAGAIVSQPIAHPHILVADTAVALNALGVASRQRTRARIAGVTGSVGKTGTKEALAAALCRWPDTRVHKSVKSYNNHTGVPLSLSRMPADSDFGVFEMGMNHAGELAALTRMVRPHVALVTAIAPAHIEFFASEAAIADAKAEIFQGLEPGGTAIIPFDSPHRERLMRHARDLGVTIVTFGIGDGADVRAREAMLTRNGTLITAVLPGAELCFTVGQQGDHWVSNALAVIAAVQALGADLATAGLALAELEGLAGRGARSTIRTGNGTALLIDESYNANAASMVATLAVLGRETATRRIAVLGEMRELGSESERLHAAIAEPVVSANVDFALLVGPGMAALGKALEGRVEFRHVADSAAARDLIESVIAPGDAILVKGSNGVGLSAIVDALRAN